MMTRRDVFEGLGEVREALQYRIDNGYAGDREVWRALLGRVMDARRYLMLMEVPHRLTLKQVDQQSIVWMLQRGNERAEPKRILFVNANALLVIGMGDAKADMLQAKDYLVTWVCFDKEPHDDQVAGMIWEDDGCANDDGGRSSGVSGSERELASPADQSGVLQVREDRPTNAG